MFSLGRSLLAGVGTVAVSGPIRREAAPPHRGRDAHSVRAVAVADEPAIPIPLDELASRWIGFGEEGRQCIRRHRSTSIVLATAVFAALGGFGRVDPVEAD